MENTYREMKERLSVELPLKGGEGQEARGNNSQEQAPNRHANNDEGAGGGGGDEIERCLEEIKRLRNKFRIMHWKETQSRKQPYPI